MCRCQIVTINLAGNSGGGCSIKNAFAETQLNSANTADLAIQNVGIRGDSRIVKHRRIIRIVDQEDLCDLARLEGFAYSSLVVHTYPISSTNIFTRPSRTRPISSSIRNFQP